MARKADTYIADPLNRSKECGGRNGCLWGFFSWKLVLAYLSLFYYLSFFFKQFISCSCCHSHLALGAPVLSSCMWLLDVTHGAQPLHGHSLPFSKWIMSSLAGSWPRRDPGDSVDYWPASPMLAAWIQTFETLCSPFGVLMVYTHWSWFKILHSQF